ncbi:MAG TPA: GTPase HflX, partial [Candidatus Acetothermia bacterium]|nr:GTPase HflX [Candidatus Acetothermia bacterium]
MDELEALAASAGIDVCGVVIQRRARPHPATYIGRGKVEELKTAVEEMEADVVIFNEELSPAQARNLESAFNRKVVDRTQLIMDIFAQRAATKEARLQVELAQLHYLLPRLRGWGTALTRAGGRAVGGVGTRGPGETQLELDRSKIYRLIHSLERRLQKATRERAVRRQRRGDGPLPQIALVGYTNSGKSTLLNRLCSADVLVEDKLFATLDPRVRRTELVPGRSVLVSDTVGFIRDLPHDLVPAFAATLEAVRTADLLIHVVDLSRSTWRQDAQSVMDTLESEVFDPEDRRPSMVTVLNKVDCCANLDAVDMEGVPISARWGTNIEALRSVLSDRLFPTPFGRGSGCRTRRSTPCTRRSPPGVHRLFSTMRRAPSSRRSSPRLNGRACALWVRRLLPLTLAWTKNRDLRGVHLDSFTVLCQEGDGASEDVVRDEFPFLLLPLHLRPELGHSGQLLLVGIVFVGETAHQTSTGSG